MTRAHGGADTVYTLLLSALFGDLKIDNEGVEGARTPLPDPNSTLDGFTIINGSHVEISMASTISINTADLTLDSEGHLTTYGTDQSESHGHFSQLQVDGSASLSVGDGGVLIADSVTVSAGPIFLDPGGFLDV